MILFELKIVLSVFVILRILPNLYYDLLQKLPTFVQKPLGMCETCATGQASLWFTIGHLPFSLDVTYLGDLIFLVSLSMFMSIWMQKFEKWLEK